MTNVMAEPLAEEGTPLEVFDAPAYSAPRVNLLPPEISERRALRKLQAGLGAGVIAAAAVVGMLYVQASNGKADAQNRLNAATSEKTVLDAQTAKLSYVSAQKATIDAARASLKTALAGEVLWSKTLDNLRVRLPDGVRYASFTVAAITPAAGAATTAGTTASTAAAASTVPAGSVATVTLTGSAVDLDAVATELDQLALVPGFSNVYLTTTTQAASSTSGSGIATFSATADITNAVLSHRYDNLTGGSN